MGKLRKIIIIWNTRNLARVEMAFPSHRARFGQEGGRGMTIGWNNSMQNPKWLAGGPKMTDWVRKAI